MADPNKFYDEITEEHLKSFSFIGQGSFGDIFRARHQDWGIDVAIKFLNRNSSFTQEELLKEARAMDKARFTYILRLFGLFIGKTQTDAALVPAMVPSLGLVMEYMENGNLSSLMYRVPSMPWALRIRILYQVALGMNFLHNLKPPLLHLDLKPSNVLLDGDLHVRVSDFGLSKFKRGTTQQCNLSSGEGTIYGGTLEFMPPEAFIDFHYKPTPSTDVYSYGILMWSVLSSQEPYHNLHHANMSSLIRMHIPQGQRPRTEDLEKQVDQVPKLGALIDLMRRCWFNEKGQRPSFRDCSKEMEDVYSSYKWEMMPAVREVQDILMQKENSSRKEAKFPACLSSKGASRASVRAEDHQAFPSTYGLEERFKTFHLEEPSSMQNEALPPEAVFRRRSSGTLHRSQSLYNRKVAEGTQQENPHLSEVQTLQRTTVRGNKQRPRSDTFTSPVYQTYPPPAYHHYQQALYTPGITWGQNIEGFSRMDVALKVPSFVTVKPLHGLYQGNTGFLQRDQSFLWHLAPAVAYGGIHISGNSVSGIQIGGGNRMHVEQASSIKDKRKQ